MTLTVASNSSRLRNIFIAAAIVVVLLSLLGISNLSRTKPFRIPYTTFDLPSESEAGDANERPGEDAGGQDEGKSGEISKLLTPEEHEASQENEKEEHLEVFSNMTSDGSFFMIDFLGQVGFNPSILPHPVKNETWIVIAQRDKREDDSDVWNSELYCEAVFVKKDNVMRCVRSPLILPIASTGFSPLCIEEHEMLSYMNHVRGPHDARLFWGPERPYIMYGSQSQKSCLGQWIQDLRRLADWDVEDLVVFPNQTDFYWPTDLQRPKPGFVEKNWFAFWSDKGDMYLHYDLKRDHRSFAKVNSIDGTVGKDVAPLAQDEKCLQKLMPTLKDTGLEWLHQATNSLSLTLCNRADTDCHSTPENTYNLVLFQKKTFYYHGVYEPYMMLFHERAPFSVYAVSQKPIWYHGRGRADEDWRRPGNEWKPIDQSEMLFTVSMNWKKQGMRYHGYLDDEVMISFGVEDQHAGAIDVVVGELIRDMGLCD